jgi:Uma2 family endonuclease
MSSNLSPSIPPGKIVLTYDDYCLLPNDRNRYEILDGDFFVTPAPRVNHQRISRRLLRFLDDHVLANNLGEIFAAPIDVILAPTTVVQPDLIFIAHDRAHIITERAIEGAPTLVVEILSPTTQQIDRVTKAQLYAKYGVPHYWLIDPDQHVIEAYGLSGEQYNLVTRVQDADLFTSSVFPGLSIQISDLWA